MLTKKKSRFRFLACVTDKKWVKKIVPSQIAFPFFNIFNIQNNFPFVILRFQVNTFLNFNFST